MAIRPAVAADKPWILEQIDAFIKSLGYAHAFLSERAVAEAILDALLANHLVLVAVDNYGPVGMIGGEYCRHPYNLDLVTLYEHFWWVVPEKRGKSHGGRLLLKFLEEGRKHSNIIRISLEHNSQISDDSMHRLGMRLAEKTYILEVPQCQCSASPQVSPQALPAALEPQAQPQPSAPPQE